MHFILVMGLHKIIELAMLERHRSLLSSRSGCRCLKSVNVIILG